MAGEKTMDKKNTLHTISSYPYITQTPARPLQGKELCALGRIRQPGHAKGLVPCSWDLPLQPRKTFAKLLQLFNHINHSEGRHLVPWNPTKIITLPFTATKEQTVRVSVWGNEWEKARKAEREMQLWQRSCLQAQPTKASEVWCTHGQLLRKYLQWSLGSLQFHATIPLLICDWHYLPLKRKDSLWFYKLRKKHQCKNHLKAGVTDLYNFVALWRYHSFSGFEISINT